MKKQFQKIGSGMITTLLCAAMLTAIGCSHRQPIAEAEREESFIRTVTTEAPEQEREAAIPEEAYHKPEAETAPTEAYYEPEVECETETAPTEVPEASGTPDPDRFNGGMAMTSEEIAQITGSGEYQDAVRQETLYSMLTMNRETESSGSKFYLNDTVKTIPTYDADEWLWLCERAVKTHYFLDGDAPEYDTIEIYNYAETKTNFIVFVSADGHVEMVCMYQDPYLAVEFDYVGSDVELYHYMQQVSTKITADDISD